MMLVLGRCRDIADYAELGHFNLNYIQPKSIMIT